MLLKDLFENEKLPEDVIKAFEELGKLQRGQPELQMVRVQTANKGGGVLSFVVEHAGDLIHRMSHMAAGASMTAMGQEYVVDKTKKVNAVLTSGYGFEREMEENFRDNASFVKIPVEDLKNKVFEELKKYGEEHRKLPAYNNAQVLARNACIFIGERKFEHAGAYLQRLYDLAVERDRWMKASTEFERNEDGSLKKL